MKVTIDMENLDNIVEQVLKENVEEVINDKIYDSVKQFVTSYFDREIKDIVQEKANEAMTSYVEEYIKNSTITVGGGLYSKEEAKVYTIEEYIKKELADRLTEGNLKILTNDRYDKCKTVTFEEFIKNSFDAESLVKKELESFMDKIRKDINNKVNDTFNDTTKTMLSETVFNVLMKNDTFSKLNDSVKCIADKR